MTSSRDDSQPDGLPDWLPDSAAGVLAAARARRAGADRAEADLLELAVGWAVMHPAESLEDAETLRLRSFGDTDIPVAGDGAPLVREFSVAEFAAAIGLGTEAGKRYLGQAVEIRYRLPRHWKRVTAGDLPAWKARRIAERTMHLTQQAALFVDRHLAGVAHKVTPAQIERLVDEAIARHMPEEAEERRRAAWDQRHFTLDHDTAAIAGTSMVTGEIDLADALDLDQAVAEEARRIGALGNTRTLDQRRAIAIGNIARRDLTLDYPTTDYPTTDYPTTDYPATDAITTAEDPDFPQADPPQTRMAQPRKIVLHVHLSEAAVRGTGSHDGGGGELGRVENTRSPVTPETIRDWVGRPDLKVVVQPVVDLAEHVSVEAYEVPDRVAEPAVLRDVSCVFPWCTRPARPLRPDKPPCDREHVVPHNKGGPTCSCQIAPLCRRHHRLKTHGGWRYHILEPGSYIWTSPHRYQYLRDHTGTLDISHDKHRCRPQPDSGAPPADT